MRKRKQEKQINNYLTFVAAGILLIIIVALVSGCGSRSREDDSSSERKKVLSQSEIQNLTNLVVTDIEDHSLYEEDEEDVEGIITDNSDENSHCSYVWGWEDHGEDEDDEDRNILAQVSKDEKVLQTFSEEEIKLYPDKEAITEFQGVTDRELVF